MRVLVNQAMQIESENYLHAKHYERSENRQGQTNGYKLKMVRLEQAKQPLIFRRCGKVVSAVSTHICWKRAYAVNGHSC